MTHGEMREALSELGTRLEETKLMMDYAAKLQELAALREKLKDTSLWDDPQRARHLGQRTARLAEVVELLNEVQEQFDGVQDFFNLLEADAKHQDLQDNLTSEIRDLYEHLEKLETAAMFNDLNDERNAFLEVQAGSGGTEAQDWAEMLLRMYLKWADAHKYKAEVLEISTGEVAGIKRASIQLNGVRAYGWLRTESGIHRLVRKSPFNANNKRHTSFASVFVLPELDGSIEVEINPKDLRIDTYRASGAGGQHVNKTDSAVRITHLPTGLVTQCQNQRSQHQNKEKALKQLHARIYMLEEEKQKQEQLKLEESKEAISWGRQIRSYVLDDSRIKDLRTGLEKSDCPRVLNGDLDDFMLANLRLAAQTKQHTGRAAGDAET